MVATSPSAAINPGLPRRTTQEEVAELLAPFMVLRDGILHRSQSLDWDAADRDIRARWGARGLKRVRRMVWKLAAARWGLVNA